MSARRLMEWATNYAVHLLCTPISAEKPATPVGRYGRGAIVLNGYQTKGCPATAILYPNLPWLIFSTDASPQEYGAFLTVILLMVAGRLGFFPKNAMKLPEILTNICTYRVEMRSLSQAFRRALCQFRCRRYCLTFPELVHVQFVLCRWRSLPRRQLAAPLPCTSILS